MKRLILLAFIGAFLTDVHGYPSSLASLFSVSDKLNEAKEEMQTVCQTQECKKMAKIILNSMNKSVDPCDDFYEYACGEYPIHNPLPEGYLKWSSFFSLQMNVQRQIKEILDAGPKDNDLFAVKLAKKWYKSCMDTDAMEKQDLDPLVSTISRIGGWPMIMHPDEWDEQEYSWQKVDDQYMRLTGRNAFHDVRVEYGGNDTLVIHVDTPHLPPSSYKLFFELETETSDEENSHEDPSDEEKQSDEEGNSDPWSEGEDDSKDDENDYDDEDRDKSGDDNSADNEISDDDTTERVDNKDTKKINKTKARAGKVGRKKNRRSGQSGRKKSDARITKQHDSHKAKRERVKRRELPRKVNDKRAQHSVHREKLHARKDKRNHARRMHRQRKKKTIDDNEEAMHTTIKPQVTTEETKEEVEMELLKRYADYISKVARAVANARGIQVSEKSMDKDIEDMIVFQLKLVNIVTESEESLESTLTDFQDWYDEKDPETDNSNINWLYKIEELFDEANVFVDDDLEIEVLSLDYFEALLSLLDETSSRTIVNYIHWNFISRIIKTTTSELREMYDAWKKDDDDDDDDEPRSAVCIKEVKMSDILAYEYVRKHFSDDVIETAVDMLDDIQKEVEYQIKESEWMDDDTKDFVLAKLVKMEKLIGYPDWYTNSTIVKRYFQGLIIGKSYYENTLSYDRYVKWKELRKLTITDVNEEMELLAILEVDPAEVNAFYIPQVNFITITAADFQSPFFAYNRPHAINFGIIGFMMAHEVNHGFDNTGHLYDKNGDEVGWLSTMAQAYGKRTECFVEQFNNYPIDKSNKKIENFGNQTTGDNIADTMGLQAGFKAYRRRERECGKQDIVLPGLEDITNDQLFFLSFANIWCEVVDPNYIMALAKNDEHSPGRLRVIGSVSNSEDFAKAYNCPADSPMNPEKKCSIWK